MTNILLYVFLPCHDSAFPDLKAHLCRLIVHESPKRRRELSASASASA